MGNTNETDMKGSKKRKAVTAFAVTLIITIALLAGSIAKTAAYNARRHHEVFTGPALFSSEEAGTADVSVKAAARSSTWTKLLDVYDEGLEEHNYQAYTYDFTVSNNTRDEV